jgi:hypothetical protein
MAFINDILIVHQLTNAMHEYRILSDAYWSQFLEPLPKYSKRDKWSLEGTPAQSEASEHVHTHTSQEIMHTFFILEIRLVKSWQLKKGSDN